MKNEETKRYRRMSEMAPYPNCTSERDGWLCNLAAGHAGDHVRLNSTAGVVQSWRDEPEPEPPTPEAPYLPVVTDEDGEILGADEPGPVAVEVEMLAFMDGAIRTVEIPADEYLASPTPEATLDLVFRYGQNDVQPKQFCSVSVGDVIRFRGERFRVEPTGFARLAPEVEPDPPFCPGCGAEPPTACSCPPPQCADCGRYVEEGDEPLVEEEREMCDPENGPSASDFYTVSVCRDRDECANRVADAADDAAEDRAWRGGR